MISCMGGWCNQRDKCWHYHVESHIIVERLCGKLEEPEVIKETSFASNIKIGIQNAKMDRTRH